MTNEEYRRHPAVSRSDLWMLKKSPAHFKWAKEHPPEKTKALVFGAALHKMILEPETFEEEFALAPIMNKRTKDGRLQLEWFLAENEGKDVIDADDLNVITAMHGSIRSNKYARALLTGKHEVPYFWTDDLTGEKCKVRVDSIRTDAPIIADIKTCTDASTEAFSRDMIKYGYDLQAYMYTHGVEMVTGKPHQFVFIAIEKTPPYVINILQADGYVMMRGESIFREFLGMYHDCKETGNWYGYTGFSGMINNLTLPGWIRKEYE